MTLANIFVVFIVAVAALIVLAIVLNILYKIINRAFDPTLRRSYQRRQRRQR